MKSGLNWCRVTAPTTAHPCEQTVEEVGINQRGVETAEWSVEDESREGSVVVVSNADIDPWTVVVHLHNTPGVGGKEEGGRVRVFLSQ